MLECFGRFPQFNRRVASGAPLDATGSGRRDEAWPKRVLIADASASDRQTLRRHLGQGSCRDCDIVEVESWAEILTTMQTGQMPDLLLLGTNLNDGSALDVLTRLAGKVAAPACPVIVLRTPNDALKGRLLIRAGAQDYLNKNELDPFTLDRVIENAAERWSQMLELREHEAALRLQRKRMPIGCLVTDIDFTILDWNPACERIFGFTYDEVVGRCSYDLIIPADAYEHVSSIQTRLGAGDATAHSINTNVTKDGRRILCEWHNTPLLDADGRVHACLCMVQDVTEREHTAAILREKEAELRLTLEASNTGTWTWDLLSDTVRWSPECYRIHGCEPGTVEESGTAFFKMIHGEDWERVRRTVQAAIASNSLYECEFRIVRASGEVVWVSGRGRASYDADGRPIRMLGTVTDISSRKGAELELARRDAFAHSVIESSPDCLIGLALDGRTLWANQAAEQLRRSAEDDPGVGQTWVSLWGAGDTRAQAEAALDSARAGKTSRFRGYCATSCGEPRWWDVTVSPIPGPDGEIEQLLTISHDITELHSAEERLKQAQALTQSVIDGASALIFAKDLHGRYIMFNRAWLNFVGLTAEQALGRSDEEVFGREIAEQLICNDRAVLEANAALVMEEAATFKNRPVIYLSSKFPLHDAAGRVYAICGVSSDITDLKRIQAQLQTRERELQTLADNSPDILARFDERLRHVFVSLAIEKIVAIPRAAFIGKTNRELGIDREFCDGWEAAIRRTFATGQSQYLEFSFEGQNGMRHYESRLVPEIDEAGRVGFVLAMTRDITERRAAEIALREADRRKDEFLATLAHELRNPLAPIRSGLHVLRLTRDEQTARTLQDMMERQLAHMVRLIDDLLDVSRITSGKIVLRPELTSLQAVADLAVEATRSAIEADRHTFELDLPREPIWLFADQTRLCQVLSNLISNAAKYSPPGSAIRLAARCDAQTVVIRLSDTGLGIPPDMLSRVFNLFTQAHHNVEWAKGGLGIGLALVKRLVEMHGGTIRADSPGLGHGSIFTLTLPMTPAPASLAINDAADLSGSQPGRRILVIDDNVDAADSLAMILNLWGHTVQTAYDGSTGLANARCFLPDIIFIDIGLPDMTGYELAVKMRKDADLHRSFLIALTGWGTEEDKQHASGAGFDLHMTKPVETRALAALLAVRVR